jgi:hypothetical protein
MQKFLIEVPHPAEELACARVVHVFLNTGSHFLSQADWGCADGVHSAWFTVEAENKAEARLVVPPAFRSEAKITGLCKFTLEEIEEIISRHQQR